VSNPSYVPKKFTTEPHAFGKVADIEWIPVDEANPAPGLASRIQHRQCFAIHEAIVRRYGAEGVAGYIRNSNDKVTDQFRRALRGEAVLHLRDIAYALHHFGADLDLSFDLEPASR